jgi:uncharacterized damage-inducible protein DinB
MGCANDRPDRNPEIPIMTRAAQAILAALEFRMPMLMRNIEPLDEAQMRWRPAPDRNSIAWQLWHIAEVEDNWIRTIVLDEPPHLPFGMQMREAGDDDFPTKAQLIDYLREVRELTCERLERTTDADLERVIEDADFGRMTVRDNWAGVVTSFAWHAGQIALTAKLIPDSPVETMRFHYWKTGPHAPRKAD